MSVIAWLLLDDSGQRQGSTESNDPWETVVGETVMFVAGDESPEDGTSEVAADSGDPLLAGKAWFGGGGG
jgi:hypothetical protein